MALSYAYSGNTAFIEAVAPRLEAAGLTRTSEVAAADVVVSYCTSQSQLEDLYFGEAGFVQEVAAGSLLIDLSATTPGFAREINAVAAVSDLSMVEAPLVVQDMVASDAFARDNLACFAAGEDDGVARAREVLDALCATVHVAGGPGAAQLARAAYTLQVAAQVISAVEADALYRAVRRSPVGVNAGLAVKRPGAVAAQGDRVLAAVEAGRFDGAYSVEMLMAELSAAIMAADDAELILPQAEAAMHLLELLAVVGGADKSPAALSLVYGDEATCAANGLDWTRAEEAYGTGRDEDDCGCGHSHGTDDADDYDGYDDLGSYDDPYNGSNSWMN